MNVGRWVEKWGRLAPEKIAVVDEGGSVPYRQLNERANRLANFLLAKGIRRGDRVGVLLYNGREFIEIYAALGKIGAVLVPLNWRMPAPELKAVIEDAETRVLILDAEFEEAGRYLSERLTVSNLFLTVGAAELPWALGYGEIDRYAASEPAPADPPEPEDPHILLYSSGTTGTPKGVLLSHRKTFYNCLNSDIWYRLTPEDVFLVHRPLFHSGGLLVDSSPALYKGATLVYKRHFDHKEFAEAIERHQATVLEPAPAFLSRIAADFDIRKVFRSVRSCYTGGERVPEALLRHYHAHGIPVCQIFGMSETSVVCFLSKEDAARKVGSVGKPCFHTEVRIVDSEMRDVAPNVIGEIVVGGPVLMSGYWKQPELTRETIRDGWYLTGDLARFDDEGFIFIVGRRKEMYISGGENVYPAEVEKALLAHPMIVDVAVCGVPDEKWGEVGKAWLVRRPDQELTSEEVLSFLTGRIAKYKIPKHVDFVESLPRTASGKVQKFLLLQESHAN